MNSCNVDLRELLSQVAEIKLIPQECTGAQAVIASSTDKEVRITWAQSANEIFFDFVLEQGERHSNWIDFYDGETIEEIGAYLVEVVTRFFAYDTRIHNVGGLLKVSNVEYAVHAEWHLLLSA